MDFKKDIIEKPYYDILFVVLVYKNVEVLKGFFASLKMSCTYKVVLVNSFFDEITENNCRLMADNYHADFIAVPNKGYGTGNNIGCQYAIDNYQFRYLIISNSDVVIRDLSCLQQITDVRAVYAPDIEMINGHHQNPNIPVELFLYTKLLDISYQYGVRFLKTMALAINRACREIFVGYHRLMKHSKVKIFSGHGSCMILTYRAIIDLMPVFHEDMFLYNEELYLAYRCRLQKIPIYYVPLLKINHLEGASSTRESDKWENHAQSYQILTAWLKKNYKR